MSLHPVAGPEAGNEPEIVQCPDCGQMEWWTLDERMNHGACRSQAGRCQVCGQTVGGPDLVGTAEIAQRLGVAQATVHSWRHRHPKFPAPILILATGPIWRWEDVAEWASQPRRAGRPRSSSPRQP